MTIQIMRKVYAALAMLCVAIPSSALAEIVYEVDLVVTAKTGIVSFDVARADSDRFRRAAFVKSLEVGDAHSATVQILDRGDGCVRDLRVSLADGSVLVRRGLDLCRSLRKNAATTDRGEIRPVSSGPI